MKFRGIAATLNANQRFKYKVGLDFISWNSSLNAFADPRRCSRSSNCRRRQVLKNHCSSPRPHTIHVNWLLKIPSRSSGAGDSATSVTAVSEQVHLSSGAAFITRAGNQLAKLRGYTHRYGVLREPSGTYYLIRLKGLYYPPFSLKTRLCLRGRKLIYEWCEKHAVPHRKTGKLVVALAHQKAYVEQLHAKAKKLQWPTHSDPHPNGPVLPTELITGDRARELEPDLSKDIVAALWSPETGIFDSHSFMESMEKVIIDSNCAELVYSTRVVRVDPFRSVENAHRLHAGEGWVVQTVTGDSDQSAAILARTLINASGLSAHLIPNSILPQDARIPMYYARGSYASYKGPGVSHINKLIYPCPDTSRSHAFESLGTHLTLDIEGKVRFGPDIEWLSPPTGSEDSAFWKNHLVPDDSKLRDMHEAILQYLPGVTFEGLQPDYVGIRPKLIPPGGGFQDFVVRTDCSTDFTNKQGKEGLMISLLGIESPGLTSSLAIAELVVEDIVAV